MTGDAARAAGSAILFRRELEVFFDEFLSEEGRVEIFVGIATAEVEAFRDAWAAQTGNQAQIRVFVDGQEGKSIREVSSSGTVAATAETIGAAAVRTLQLYQTFAKVVTGEYAADLAVFVNGTKRSRDSIRDVRQGAEVQITNLSPFARKAEVRGFNDAAAAGFRNGLFEGIAAIVRKEFGEFNRISFRFDTFGAGGRLPSIVIR